MKYKEPVCPKCSAEKLTVFFMNGKIYKDYCCMSCWHSFGYSVVKKRFYRVTKAAAEKYKLIAQDHEKTR